MNNSERALGALRSATINREVSKEELGVIDNTPTWDAELVHNTSHFRRLRLLSDESQESDNIKSISLGFSDSGHYSSANSSDFQTLTDTHAEPVVQNVLRQKDKALFLALQDVRRLRSELERLRKSEQWYKQELRTQKHSRLEALEKMYTNERNYMQENQRLQRECLRLYTKCGEVEHALKEQRLKALAEINKDSQGSEPLQRQKVQDIDFVFENQQQRALIADQQQLIDVLRKQKRSLLDELKRLSEEKDVKIYELHGALAQLEQENQRVIKKCKSLLNERDTIEAKLNEKIIELEGKHTEQQKLESAVQETRSELEAQQRHLLLKEKEILELQRNFKEDLRDEMEADTIHRLSMNFHQEIMQKTTEIATLKNSLFALQQELVDLEDVRAQNEQQQREMDELRSSLLEKDLLLSNLRECNAKKSTEIIELKSDITEYQGFSLKKEQNQDRRQNYFADLMNSQEALKRTQDELVQINERYESMSALCQRTRFDLEMREIECEKLQFNRRKDADEIETLRKKLAAYLYQTEQLSLRIKELEQTILELTEFHIKTGNVESENEKLLKENKWTQWELFSDILEESGEYLGFKNKRKEWRKSICSLEDEIDYNNMNSKLHEMNEYIQHLEAKNHKLNDFIREKTIEANADEDICANKEGSERFPQDIILLETNAKTEAKNLKENLLEMHFINQLQKENQKLRKLAAEQTNLSLGMHKNTEQNECAVTQKLNQQNVEVCEKSTSDLDCMKKANRNPQLLTNDEILNQLEKVMDRVEDTTTNGRSQLPEEENERKELETIRLEEVFSKQKLQENIERSEALELLQENKELRLGQQVFGETGERIDAQRELEKDVKQRDTTIFSRENDDQELLSLREKVKELEKKLDEVQNSDNQQREKRIQLITKLLDQQNQKVAQLNTSQADWEELLKNLNDTQAMEEATRAELQQTREQLEELNAVFHEQNEELQRLHALSLMQEASRDEEVLKTFREEVDVMKKKLANSESKNEEQAKIIEILKLKNQHLEEDIDEEYSKQAEEHKEEIRVLRNQIENVTGEQRRVMQRMQDKEQELRELRHSKRDAIITPPIDKGNALRIDSCEEGYKDVTDDHFRILTKVIENEYKRKMSRYDQHIHALLTNVKNLKRSLAAEEQKANALQEQHTKMCMELQELQTTRRQLQDTRQRFEKSQQTIKQLERVLETTRKQYESTDAGKSQLHETTHEVANLIDDYKKLIQQSMTTTKRPQTSAILDLIQRSNQCVPNLNQIESSVNDLRTDLQEYIAGQRSLGNPFLLGPKMPSLLDELKVATEIAQMSNF